MTSTKDLKASDFGRVVDICRMCKSNRLEKFLDLGFTPPSDSFLTKEDLKEPETHYPLEVYLCHGCGLMQLGYVVSPIILYQANYPYEASTTRTGQEHFRDMAKSICERFQISSGSLIVDVGSNVGVLLSGFKSQGMKVLGVDPAKNMADIANVNGIETIPDFFSSDIAHKIINEKGQASVITATNAFAHIDDLDDVMRAVDILLNERGVFIVEAPYAVDLVRNLEYDTIYHEHLMYLSVRPLVAFFEKFNMKLFDVDREEIHGGTIRFFVSRRTSNIPVSPRVKELLDLEEMMQLYSTDTLGKFSANVANQRTLLISLLHDLKQQGKKIVGVSAPAKGNTLLNYCKIDGEFLDYITEKSQVKIGLFTPGTHIAIYEDEKLLQDKPDYALLLAWNFAKEIMANLSEFKARGGRFIIPIPEPKIV